MVKQRSQRSERAGKGKWKGKGKAVKVKRGIWTAEEDNKLVSYVKAHGDKKWRQLPAKAGLNRCGRSCRLRWLNYLRPGIKRGNISEDEEDLIIRLHNLLGNRWSIIAGRIPGRTDNEIKNHWNTHLSKRSLTINDLNKKQNRTSESISATMPTSASPANVNDDEMMLGSWMELCGSEFDTEPYFRALLPASDCYSTGIISELGILEDYGILNLDNNQNSQIHEIYDFDKQNFWDGSLDNVRIFEFEDSNQQLVDVKPL